MATPFTAETATVPPSVAPPGLVPIEIDALPLKPVTSAFRASCSSATTAGVTAAPATSEAAGCCVTTHVWTALNAAAVTVSGVTPAVAMPSDCVPTVDPSVQVADA